MPLTEEFNIASFSLFIIPLIVGIHPEFNLILSVQSGEMNGIIYIPKVDVPNFPSLAIQVKVCGLMSCICCMGRRRRGEMKRIYM